MRNALLILLLSTGWVACGGDRNTGDARATDLRVLTNWQPDQERKTIDLDYTQAVDSGFYIPGAGQVEGGRFTFSFHVPGGTPVAYKLYWANESYRFPHADDKGAQHPLAHENFYGSWDDPKEGFRTAAGPQVNDDLRILPDPRYEPQFVDGIGRHSRRSRNPRVGEYKFMLVVMDAGILASSAIPAAVLDISALEKDRYVDPFWYWVDGPGARLPGVQVVHARERLAVRARPDLGAGVHVPSDAPRDSSAYTATCGSNEDIRHQAAFEQFIHYVDASTRFANIPVTADLLGNGFTPEDHDRYRCLFPQEDLVMLRPMTARTPCATVFSDPERRSITLWNPASTPGDLRKENVGIRTMHGHTYGRFRVKCKLTRLLNEHDMWVGLTNAIWLINDGAPGVLRRPCRKDGGYMSDYYGGSTDKRVPQVAYSEIDFEILKTVAYCPDRAFPPAYPQAFADPDDRDAWRSSNSDARTDRPGMITVACTNWDMACHDPQEFGAGCRSYERQGGTFVNHRWDDDYRAVTQKVEASDEELFGGDHFWFEIDWRPDQITWRIGPELDQLRVVGHMDGSMTSITNVQMQLIVTQEYHNTRWWPGTPYEQGFIPFPAKDLVGEVLDVIIE